MQQPVPSSSQPTSNRNRWLLFGGAALILLICCCLGLALRVGRNVAAVPTRVPATTPTLVLDNNATVVINVPTSTAGPTPTLAPTIAPTQELGKTRDLPYPKNTTVDIGDGMLITITLVTRPANDVVAQGNMFNDTPVPNVQEYLLVRLHVECTKPSNEKCMFDHFEFKTVGADGQVHDQSFVSGIPQPFESYAEFFGGSVLDGNMVFLVPQGDSKVVLFHDPLFGDPGSGPPPTPHETRRETVR